MSKVAIDQVWEIQDPSGERKQIRISHLMRGVFGHRVARAVPLKAPSRFVVVPISRLEKGEYGSRLVADVPRKAS